MATFGKQVVFLSGPIGVGKSTIGAAVAQRLGGAFIESDWLGDPSGAWNEQIDAVNGEIVAQSLQALDIVDVAVVELPLDAARWQSLNHAFGLGVQTRCITLAATYDAIIAPARGRIFSGWELARIMEMIAEGYDRRSFSEAIVRTDHASIECIRDEIVALVAVRTV